MRFWKLFMPICGAKWIPSPAACIIVSASSSVKSTAAVSLALYIKYCLHIIFIGVGKWFSEHRLPSKKCQFRTKVKTGHPVVGFPPRPNFSATCKVILHKLRRSRSRIRCKFLGPHWGQFGRPDLTHRRSTSQVQPISQSRISRSARLHFRRGEVQDDARVHRIHFAPTSVTLNYFPVYFGQVSLDVRNRPFMEGSSWTPRSPILSAGYKSWRLTSEMS